jgi:DNA-binding transcriptional regulator YbjK
MTPSATTGSAATTDSAPIAGAELSPRRRRLLDAALHVVADEGLRGLTHRAVDRRAELPEGTCSAYLRTRHALLAALTEYVAATLHGDIDRLAAELVGCTGGDDRPVELAMAMFSRWLEERELLLAKLELSLEASRNPDLADRLAAWRERLVGVVEQILSERGTDQSRDRAEALTAAFDGILFAALLKPPRERRRFLARALGLTMNALTGD